MKLRSKQAYWNNENQVSMKLISVNVGLPREVEWKRTLGVRFRRQNQITGYEC